VNRARREEESDVTIGAAGTAFMRFRRSTASDYFALAAEMARPLRAALDGDREAENAIVLGGPLRFACHCFCGFSEGFFEDEGVVALIGENGGDRPSGEIIRDLRRGSGEMLDQIRLVNPALADQMARARDTTAALDLLAKAYADAGTQEQRNRLAQAAFGRGGVGVGNAILPGAADAGGFAQMGRDAANAGGIIDRNLIQKLKDLDAQIKKLKSDNADGISSIFAVQQKEAQLETQKALQWVVDKIKEMNAEIDDGRVERYFAAMARGLGDTLGMTDRAPVRITIPRPSPEPEEFPDGAPFPRPRPSSADKTATTPEYDLQMARGLLSVLGGAATPAEQLQVKMQELDAAVRKYGADTETAKRAKDFLNDSDQLGIESARERLGLASQEAILTARLIELKRQEATAGIKPGSAEYNAAQARVQRAAEQSFRQEQINNSAFKGLAQMANPDVNQEIDKLATGSLDNLSKTLVEIATNTHKGAQAWREFGMSAITAVEQLIVRMMVLGPLAQGMSTMMGGGAASLFGAGGFKFAGGGIMTAGGPLPLHYYASGGVASGPQLAMFGEGRGPEAYVPLPDGRAIPAVVTLRGQPGAGGGHVFNTNITAHMTVPQGTSTEDAHRMSATFARQMKDMVTGVVDDRIVQHSRTGGLLNPA
jgi:hypothetical protein